jgi:hypothetical protein
VEKEKEKGSEVKRKGQLMFKREEISQNENKVEKTQ